jgi:pimeloyl-ACP methyl ester carboxylesterase
VTAVASTSSSPSSTPTSSTVVANGVDLHVEQTGGGEPLVFVHGGFTDHQAWRFVAPVLAEELRVVTYDRRGHSLSGAGDEPATRRLEEDDLIALLEALDLAPVHLVGSSYGASISLAVAARRPDLVRTVVAHEPALVDTVDGPAVDAVQVGLSDIGRQLAAGDLAGGTRRFVEELILGPGWWDQLPEATQQVMVANAGTVVDMLGDPGWATLDLGQLEAGGVPVLVTDGDASPAWLREIASGIAEQAPSIARATYPGAGHMPHITHPTALVTAVRQWTVGGAAAVATGLRAGYR